MYLFNDNFRILVIIKTLALLTRYNWTNYTILIAEDDRINFRYLQLVLEKNTGVNIIWAKDGLEAYEKIINFSGIDLVLLDYQLPELNGLEVLQLVKRVRPELPIIMQTAKTWNNEEETCMKAGCDGFFSKPLKVDVLFEFIGEKLSDYALKKQKAI